MRVVVKGNSSSWTDVISGVPQGSVLGHLLFLLYVNDLPDWIKNSIKLFACDTIIWVWAKITGSQDALSLQEDLNQLQTWTDSMDVAAEY